MLLLVCTRYCLYFVCGSADHRFEDVTRSALEHICAAVGKAGLSPRQQELDTEPILWALLGAKLQVLGEILKMVEGEALTPAEWLRFQLSEPGQALVKQRYTSTRGLWSQNSVEQLLSEVTKETKARIPLFVDEAQELLAKCYGSFRATSARSAHRPRKATDEEGGAGGGGADESAAPRHRSLLNLLRDLAQLRLRMRLVLAGTRLSLANVNHAGSSGVAEDVPLRVLLSGDPLDEAGVAATLERYVDFAMLRDGAGREADGGTELHEECKAEEAEEEEEPDDADTAAAEEEGDAVLPISLGGDGPGTDERIEAEVGDGEEGAAAVPSFPLPLSLLVGTPCLYDGAGL